MEYAILGIIIIIIVVSGILMIQKTKNKKEITSENSEELVLKPREIKSDELLIHMEMLPIQAIPEDSNLVEITDSKVLAHVNNLIPGLAQVGNAANNAVQAVNNGGEVLYRAVIPVGAELTNSRAMEGAVRGIYHGAEGIKGHANLIAVEAQNGTVVVANSVAAAMGVASMVVGQYYMTQINDELSKIKDGISAIADYQDNEFRSRVFSLVAHVKKIAEFQSEIIENDELRLSKIAQLDSLEEECTKLLGQTNLTLANYSKKQDLDFQSYEKELSSAQNWYLYQKTLLDVLYKISDLRYALHLGTVSREHCTSLLPTYTSQVSETQTRLTAWHQNSIKSLNINVNESKRKRDGFDGVIHFLPSLFDDEKRFKPINQAIATMIDSQVNGHAEDHLVDASELYNEDVQLIVKEGKIYYLPEQIDQHIN